MKLVDVIKNIQNSINYIDDLNCGGCVHFAYFLSEKLKKYGYTHDIIVIDDRWSSQDSVVENIQSEGCVHMLIYIKDIGYVDGQRIVKSISEFKYTDYNVYTLPKDFNLNELRLKKDIWNNTYDRRYNSTLRSTMSKEFSKFKYERKN